MNVLGMGNAWMIGASVRKDGKGLLVQLAHRVPTIATVTGLVRPGSVFATMAGLLLRPSVTQTHVPITALVRACASAASAIVTLGRRVPTAPLRPVKASVTSLVVLVVPAHVSASVAGVVLTAVGSFALVTAHSILTVPMREATVTSATERVFPSQIRADVSVTRDPEARIVVKLFHALFQIVLAMASADLVNVGATRAGLALDVIQTFVPTTALVMVSASLLDDATASKGSLVPIAVSMIAPITAVAMVCAMNLSVAVFPDFMDETVGETHVRTDAGAVANVLSVAPANVSPPSLAMTVHPSPATVSVANTESVPMALVCVMPDGLVRPAASVCAKLTVAMENVSMDDASVRIVGMVTTVISHFNATTATATEPAYRLVDVNVTRDLSVGSASGTLVQGRPTVLEGAIVLWASVLATRDGMVMSAS